MKDPDLLRQAENMKLPVSQIVSGAELDVICEVEQHLGENRVRALHWTLPSACALSMARCSFIWRMKWSMVP